MKITEDFIGNETKALTKIKIASILRWWGFDPDSYSTWGNARSDMNNILSESSSSTISDREHASSFLSKINYINDTDTVIGDILFASDEPGVWFDPSDFSTLFQDSGGTVPVTAVEQPVGLMLDKSRGKHENGPRRVNLLRNTVFAGAVSGTDTTSVQPTGWSKAFWTGGSIDVNNSADDRTITFSTTSGRMVIGYAIPVTEGRVYVCSADIEVLSGSYTAISVIDFTNTGTDHVRQYFLNGVPFDTGSTVSSGRLVCVLTVGSGASTTTFRLGSGANASRTGVIKISRPDVRLSADSSILPGYQRITESWPGAIPGNHASQATTTARPILSAKYNLLSSSANVAAAPWNSTVGTFSFAPATPYIGVEAYRVTNAGTGSFRFIAHPFTARVGTYTVSAIVEEDIANPSEYTDLGLQQAPSTTLGRIRIYWPTGSVGAASAFPLNARGSLLSSVGPNGGRVFSIQFEANVTVVGKHRALFYPSSTTQNTAGVILHCVDVRLSVDAALPSFQPVVSQTEYQTEGFPYYLSFDGVDDHLNIGVLNMSAASAAGYFSAITKLSDASSARWYSHGLIASTGSVRLLAPANSGQASVRAGFVSSSGLREVGGQSHAAPITLTVRSEIEPGVRIWVTHNNVAAPSITVVPTVFSADGVACIGAQVYVNYRANFFNGRIYALLVAGRKSSGSELAVIETFLRNKSRAY